MFVNAVSSIRASGQRHAHSPLVDVLAKFGLASRGIVYLLIGWLALLIALGHRSEPANQRGAIAEVAHHRLGTVVVVLLGIGLAAYAVWRLSEAAFGVAGEGRKTGPRLKSLVRGLAYAGLAVSTFAFLGGSRQSQDQQQASATARLMRHSDGRWLVGLVGVVVIVVGAALIRDGVTRKFEKQVNLHQLTGRTRGVVLGTGLIGTVARGVVFVIAGILVVDAAWTFTPSKSTGLDGALRTLANEPFGPWLLGLLSVGLVLFGLFSLALAWCGKTR